MSARAAVERAARASYGRLVALLAAPTGDLALAEDALSGAFEEALRRWPEGGVPDNPEGWLLTVARNRQRDVWKSAAARTSRPVEEEDVVVDPLAEHDPLSISVIGERRLELLFVCSHPAIDPAVRTPLMLQAALGFEAQQIARAFAVPATAMAQRLVRAKRRIKDARIPFAVPDRRAMAERLPPVLEAIYGCAAMAGQGGPEQGGPEQGGAEFLAGEAQYLAVTLAVLLGNEAEAWGLAALTTLTLARARPARAAFVPLAEQDPAGWDERLIAEGEAYLRRAQAAGSSCPDSPDSPARPTGPPGPARLPRPVRLTGPPGPACPPDPVCLPGHTRPSGHACPPGRFQLEAAIQAVHVDRRRTGSTDWAALETLYAALLAVAPSLGARVAAAVVIGRRHGPDTGLAALPDPVGAVDLLGFQPYWAARADLLARAGREAAGAYARAIGLAEKSGDDAVATFLRIRARVAAQRH